VYLSTDSTPANKVLIAIEAGWNQVRNFDGQANGRLLVDVGTADERWNNQSKAISMTAGTAYYIEGLMKEGGGGDNICRCLQDRWNLAHCWRSSDSGLSAGYDRQDLRSREHHHAAGKPERSGRHSGDHSQ